MLNRSEQNQLEVEINELRLLVFLEVEPQSNKYNQVLLTSEQFKKVSDGIVVEKVPTLDMKDGFESWTNYQSEEEYVLPDLQSICPSQ